MTGDKQGGDGRGDSDAEKDPNREDAELETLLTNLRAIAKADEAELASMPPDLAAPLTAAERSDIAAAILAAPAGEAPAFTQEAGDVLPLAVARRRRRRLWMAIAPALAAAAGLALVIGRLSGNALPPLPGYEVSVAGGLKQLRGAEPARAAPATTAPPQRVARGTELMIVARPETPVEGAVAARAFLVEGGAARELAADIELAASGAALIRVRPADATAAAGGGRGEVRVVVGRPEAVKVVVAAGAAAGESGAGVRWLTVPVEVAGETAR